MLSDRDIQDKIDSQELVIEPFEDNCLTPVGYDLRVGIKGFSWKNCQHSVIDENNSLKIDPHDTVIVETYESVTLSKQLGGTIHSVATLTLTQGFSHISTTVDPGWRGKLLISFHNHLDIPFELSFKKPFCTICLYQMQSEARKDVLRHIDRADVWDELVRRAGNESRKLQQDASIEASKQQKEVEKKKRDQDKEKVRFAIYRVSTFLLILGSGVIGSYFMDQAQVAVVIPVLAAAAVLLPDILNPK